MVQKIGHIGFGVGRGEGRLDFFPDEFEERFIMKEMGKGPEATAVGVRVRPTAV